METSTEPIPYGIANVRNMARKPKGIPGATIARITSKGQMTVPKAVRDFMGLKPGDAVIISMLGPEVTIERITPLDEWERPEIPEHLRNLTDEERERLIDEGYRQAWLEKAARDSLVPAPEHEADR